MTNMFTGWHYTSWDNWRRIRSEGLIPYSDSHFDEARVRYGLKETKIIYVYDNQQHGKSLFGIVGYHCTKKLSLKIVELQVTYYLSDSMFASLNNEPRCVGGFHCLPDNINDAKSKGFFHNGEPFHYLSTRIPPRRVHLMRVFDITKIMEANK